MGKAIVPIPGADGQEALAIARLLFLLQWKRAAAPPSSLEAWASHIWAHYADEHASLPRRTSGAMLDVVAKQGFESQL